MTEEDTYRRLSRISYEDLVNRYMSITEGFLDFHLTEAFLIGYASTDPLISLDSLLDMNTGWTWEDLIKESYKRL